MRFNTTDHDVGPEPLSTDCCMALLGQPGVQVVQRRGAGYQ